MALNGKTMVLVLLLAFCAMQAHLTYADGSKASSTGPTPTPNTDEYTPQQRDAMMQRISETIDPDTPPAYTDISEEQTGTNAYQLRSQAPKCIIMTKGWLKDRFGRPGCFKALGSRVTAKTRWLCWYHATFYNNCAGRYTRAIYFNCCDKKNGLFEALNPTFYLGWAWGPNNSPSWYDCSCEYQVTIQPGQSRSLHYLAYGSRDVRLSDNPNLTPWDTYVTATMFWPRTN